LEQSCTPAGGFTSIISNLAIFFEKVIGSDIDLQLLPGDLQTGSRRPFSGVR
jgi:hypothetical protein